MLLAAALAAGQALTNPSGAGWQRIEIDSPAGEVWVHPASVRRRRDVARAVIKVRVTGPQGDEPSMFVTRMRFDCAANTAGFEAGDDYGPDGGFVESHEFEQVRMHPIEAGSVQEHVKAIACARPESLE
jgi:hypothetical protein